ncbi:UbiA family prenyltransferase [Schleiferiaceae bacterium]|nr:UbiA family prenyltransferase [Schleiferiaceae bacterium]
MALLSQIRWYNILLLLLGQYLAALYVFADKYARIPLLTDAGTHLSIWASALILASGFLINTFYDIEADSINRPRQTSFERLVRKSTSLRVAGILLFSGLLIAFSVSWRALGYYGLYAFLLWLYSHRLRNIPFVGHASAAIIGLMPFFGISVYHDFISIPTLAYGMLLGLALFSRELVKDLLGFKGDIIAGKVNVAAVYGTGKVQLVLVINTVLAWTPAYFTRPLFSDYASYGIVTLLLMLTVSNLIALRSINLHNLRWAHLGYKLVLVIGVLTIPFL